MSRFFIDSSSCMLWIDQWVHMCTCQVRCITQIQQVARDDINVDNKPALAIILGDIKNSLTWSLDMIRRALVAEDVGLYYAVRLIQSDFLKPGINTG